MCKNCSQNINIHPVSFSKGYVLKSLVKLQVKNPNHVCTSNLKKNIIFLTFCYKFKLEFRIND